MQRKSRGCSLSLSLEERLDPNSSSYAKVFAAIMDAAAPETSSIVLSPLILTPQV